MVLEVFSTASLCCPLAVGAKAAWKFLTINPDFTQQHLDPCCVSLRSVHAKAKALFCDVTLIQKTRGMLSGVVTILLH